MNSPSSTTDTATQEANRMWSALAVKVVLDTGGNWMTSGWLYVPGTGNRQLCGLILQPLAGGPEVEIETPEQYEEFLRKERPND